TMTTLCLMRQPPRKPDRWQGFRPAVEALEELTLPALLSTAAPTLLTASGGLQLKPAVLEVSGSDGNDYIRIEYTTGLLASVIATVRDGGPKGTLLSRQETRVPFNGLVLNVLARGGNDQVFNLTNLAATISGGPGRDTLYGGSGADGLYGEGEDDT